VFAAGGEYHAGALERICARCPTETDDEAFKQPERALVGLLV
jgi:hypothetical protein